METIKKKTTPERSHVKKMKILNLLSFFAMANTQAEELDLESRKRTKK